MLLMNEINLEYIVYDDFDLILGGVDGALFSRPGTRTGIKTDLDGARFVLNYASPNKKIILIQ